MDLIKKAVEETIASAIKAGFEYVNQLTRVQIFHTLQKVLIDVVQQSSLEAPLIHQIDKWVASHWFMDNLAQPMIGSTAMIKLVLQLKMGKMVEMNDKCSPERKLKQNQEPIECLPS